MSRHREYLMERGSRTGDKRSDVLDHNNVEVGNHSSILGEGVIRTGYCVVGLGCRRLLGSE
jgi:hypothetical protein